MCLSSSDAYSDRCFLDLKELRSKAHWNRVKEGKARLATITEVCFDCGREVFDWAHLYSVYECGNAQQRVYHNKIHREFRWDKDDAPVYTVSGQKL